MAVDGSGNVFVTNSMERDKLGLRDNQVFRERRQVTPIPLNIEKISNQVVLTWAGPELLAYNPRHS